MNSTFLGQARLLWNGTRRTVTQALYGNTHQYNYDPVMTGQYIALFGIVNPHVPGTKINFDKKELKITIYFPNMAKPLERIWTGREDFSTITKTMESALKAFPPPTFKTFLKQQIELKEINQNELVNALNKSKSLSHSLKNALSIKSNSNGENSHKEEVELSLEEQQALKEFDTISKTYDNKKQLLQKMQNKLKQLLEKNEINNYRETKKNVFVFTEDELSCLDAISFYWLRVLIGLLYIKVEYGWNIKPDLLISAAHDDGLLFSNEKDDFDRHLSIEINKAIFNVARAFESGKEMSDDLNATAKCARKIYNEQWFNNFKQSFITMMFSNDNSEEYFYNFLKVINQDSEGKVKKYKLEMDEECT